MGKALAPSAVILPQMRCSAITAPFLGRVPVRPDFPEVLGERDASWKPRPALTVRARADYRGKEWKDRSLVRRKHLDLARKDPGEQDGLGAVSLVLDWTANRGELATNPFATFPRIYRVNRADVLPERTPSRSFSPRPIRAGTGGQLSNPPLPEGVEGAQIQ